MNEQARGSKSYGICVPNTEQHDLQSPSGAFYRISVSWPLGWKDKEPPADKIRPVKILYVADSNANFFTAMESVRRQSIFDVNKIADMIVVGLGYSIENPESLYDARRSLDFHPKPSKPPISDGSLGKAGEIFGGANNFLDFIQTIVKPFVKNEVFKNLDVKQEALFGHSYGGLFAIYTLFTRSEMFDTYFAASPSIWWHDQYIKDEEELFQAAGGAKDKTLTLSYGSDEQVLIQHPRQSEEEFEKRKGYYAKWNLGINSEELYERLQRNKVLKNVSLRVYQGQDHMSVIPCAIEAAVISLFLDG